ncbi:MAG: hypothetical protein ACOX9R_18545 [Armatimonadota bacterium]|jgi:hypothetical protein
MFTRATAVTLAFVVVATTGFGKVAPRPAEANDTGKILAGLAAGAVVYGILDSVDKDRRQVDRRGYYDGNRGTYKHDQDRGRSSYQFQRHQDARYRSSNQRAYDRGWTNGYNRGHDVGYNRGYDRGYDHGWADGYDYGRSRGPGWCY